jgi:hypothetical protein
MTEEIQNEGVAVPEEVVEEGVAVPEEVTTEEIITDPKIIQEAEAAVLNKKVAATAGVFFRTLAEISDEEIYELAFTPAGKNSPRLLELVNKAYEGVIVAGGDLPRVYFDHYKKLISDFSNTFVFNIDAKLEANRDTLIAKITGKTEKPNSISHKDIIDAFSK